MKEFQLCLLLSSMTRWESQRPKVGEKELRYG